MTFARLYEYAASLGSYPVIIEGVIDVKAKELSAQDELWYVPVDLDLAVSYGHIKQYRIPNVVYDGDPTWVTEIRYDKSLNVCWRRYVCCKELMHVFDNADECVNSPERFRSLVSEFEAPLPVDRSSPMYKTETRTIWEALAILCPEPVRDRLHPRWESGELSDYAVALELRIPEALIKSLMAPRFAEILATLRK